MKFWLAPLHVPDNNTESDANWSRGSLLLPLLQLQVFTLNLKSVSKQCSRLRTHEPLPLSQREDSQLASAKLTLLICVYSLFTQYKDLIIISDQNSLQNKEYFLFWDNASLYRPSLSSKHNPPASTSAEELDLKVNTTQPSSKDVSEIIPILFLMEQDWLKSLVKN